MKQSRRKKDVSKRKRSSRNRSQKSSSKQSGDYSQRGLFYFTQKAKYRFIENYNKLPSGDESETETETHSSQDSWVTTKPVPRTGIKLRPGSILMT